MIQPRRALAALLGSVWSCACSAPPTPVSAPVAVAPAPPPPPAAAPAPAAPAPADAVVATFHSTGAGSRSPSSVRMLRRVMAARGGAIELIMRGYPMVGLMVDRVISGTLGGDPDYAKRPVGTNHLEVLLIDEAAFAAPQDLDGFEGTWKVREVAGVLVASAIADTPFPASTVAQRDALHAKTRANLRGQTVAERLAGLDVMMAHHFYELAPDVIALLADGRSDNAPVRHDSDVIIGPRVVKAVAEQTLERMFRAFETPASGTADQWQAMWRELITPVAVRPPIPSTPTTIATVAMNQSWPEIVATPNGGFVIAVSRLETPLDGHTEGVALARQPFDRLWWIDGKARDGLDVAGGASEFAVVSAGDGTWSLSVVSPVGNVRATRPLGPRFNHCALAASDKGYALAAIAPNIRALIMTAYDAKGSETKSATIRIATQPSADYHNGIHPVALARRTGGWVAAVETSQHITVANLDDKLRLIGTVDVADVHNIAHPRVAVAKDRAFVAWATAEDIAKLATTVVDLRTMVKTRVDVIGSEIDLLSKPLALPDGGFVLAWIEALNELHVGRWASSGALVGTATVVAHDASFLTLAIASGPDAESILVAYEDLTRYPYALVVRRVALADIR